MEKLIFLTIWLVLFSVNVNAQKKSKEERQAGLDARKTRVEKPMRFESMPDGMCTTEHKCKIKYKYDEFEKMYVYRLVPNNYQNIVKGFTNRTYGLVKYKKEDGTEIILMSFHNSLEQCRTKDSYVSLIFDDGDVLKLPNYFSDIDCGTRSITVDITNHIDDLLTNDINKLRIMLEYNDDLEFTDNEKIIQNLKDNLTCINSL